MGNINGSMDSGAWAAGRGRGWYWRDSRRGTGGGRAGDRGRGGSAGASGGAVRAGATNVIAATAAPAKDITTRRDAKTTAGVAAAGTYTCPGFSTVDDATPLSSVMQDVYSWGGFKPYKVGNGSGNINWKLNPYNNPSWYMWFHSLRWLGQGITAAGQGDTNALAHVTTIVHDWVLDNPYSWKADVGAWESTMHRTNVLICTRQAVLAGLERDHAAGAVCLARQRTARPRHVPGQQLERRVEPRHRREHRSVRRRLHARSRGLHETLAQNRLAAAITTSIDAQGSTNEQSTGVRAVQLLALGPCGRRTAGVRRRPRYDDHHATRADGGLARPGDELAGQSPPDRRLRGRAYGAHRRDATRVRRIPGRIRDRTRPSASGCTPRATCSAAPDGARTLRSRTSRRTASGTGRRDSCTGTATTRRSRTPLAGATS